MAEAEKTTELTGKQKRFCEEYIYDWNGARAYKVAYPNVKDETARANASRLLTYANVQAYCKKLCEDDERYTGISRRMIILEHKKIVTNSIAHLHNTWIERKAFDELTDDQKTCIAEIQTRVLKRNIGTDKMPDIVDVEEIKIKLYDKQKALDSISKMLGYDAPERVDINTDMTITRRIVK